MKKISYENLTIFTEKIFRKVGLDNFSVKDLSGVFLVTSSNVEIVQYL